MKYEFQKYVEDYLKVERQKLFKPLLVLLTKWKIYPNHITFISVIMSFVTFYFLINSEFMFAFISFLVYYFCDILDGTLARFQKTASDKGKFFDMFSDNLFATLLILGLMDIGVVDKFNGTVFIYLMLLTIIFGVILTSRRYPTDWLFHPRSGFFVNAPRYIVYFFFILWVFDLFWNLNSLVLLFNFYFGILAIIYFIKCMQIETDKRKQIRK